MAIPKSAAVGNPAKQVVRQASFKGTRVADATPANVKTDAPKDEFYEYVQKLAKEQHQKLYSTSAKAQANPKLPANVRSSLAKAESVLKEYHAVSNQNSSVSRGGGKPDYTKERELVAELVKHAGVISAYRQPYDGSYDSNLAEAEMGFDHYARAATKRLDAVGAPLEAQAPAAPTPAPQMTAPTAPAQGSGSSFAEDPEFKALLERLGVK